MGDVFFTASEYNSLLSHFSKSASRNVFWIVRGVYRASRDVETTYVLLRTFGVKSVNAVVPPKEVADKREAVSAELANLICFVLERNSFGKYCD
jgi:hypothetical protein